MLLLPSLDYFEIPFLWYLGKWIKGVGPWVLLVVLLIVASLACAQAFELRTTNRRLRVLTGVLAALCGLSLVTIRCFEISVLVPTIGIVSGPLVVIHLAVGFFAGGWLIVIGARTIFRARQVSRSFSNLSADSAGLSKFAAIVLAVWLFGISIDIVKYYTYLVGIRWVLPVLAGIALAIEVTDRRFGNSRVLSGVLKVLGGLALCLAIFSIFGVVHLSIIRGSPTTIVILLSNAIASSVVAWLLMARAIKQVNDRPRLRAVWITLAGLALLQSGYSWARSIVQANRFQPWAQELAYKVQLCGDGLLGLSKSDLVDVGPELPFFPAPQAPTVILSRDGASVEEKNLQITGDGCIDQDALQRRFKEIQDAFTSLHPNQTLNPQVIIVAKSDAPCSLVACTSTALVKVGMREQYFVFHVEDRLASTPSSQAIDAFLDSSAPSRRTRFFNYERFISLAQWFRGSLAYCPQLRRIMDGECFCDYLEKTDMTIRGMVESAFECQGLVDLDDLRRFLWEFAPPIDLRTLVFNIGDEVDGDPLVISLSSSEAFSECFKDIVPSAVSTEGLQVECLADLSRCSSRDIYMQIRARISQTRPVSLRIDNDPHGSSVMDAQGARPGSKSCIEEEPNE